MNEQQVPRSADERLDDALRTAFKYRQYQKKSGFEQMVIDLAAEVGRLRAEIARMKKYG
ncbi:MAG: hypothetical protein JWN63_3428 [Candidatus Acidoferrum typicum]|nr:hypothetical protein [Candidatus Acidoferrum typicum]